MSDGLEVKGLPQPPDRHAPRLRRQRKPVSGTAKTIRAHAPAKPRLAKPKGARASAKRSRRGGRRPRQQLSTYRNFRGGRGRNWSKLAWGILKRLMAAARRGGNVGYVRNHGFTGSGYKGRTGFAGMKPRKAW